ncbi:MAG: (4Fe-4S)-binding protein [Methanotrichaceae archaeon]|nr:(4Fe-4S)-binding protein [Methanotrichaceae archaeon]
MKEYSNKEIKVIWKPEKCIHAGECVKGLPQVFCRDSTPWINMQEASSEEIMKVVDRCPSGALTYEETYEKMGAKGDISVNAPCAKVKVMKNGPLLVEGGCALMNSDGIELAGHGPYALCRCGSSQKKPFCDGNHTKLGFDDTK